MMGEDAFPCEINPFVLASKIESNSRRNSQVIGEIKII
jgi:hypothetical protein